MVHDQPNSNLPAMRKAHPEAMIIRRVGPGHYVAFDRVSDASGHWSAERQPALAGQS